MGTSMLDEPPCIHAYYILQQLKPDILNVRPQDHSMFVCVCVCVYV